MLEKTFESPLDGKEIKSVYLKGNQPWIFIGKTDAEAEVPILQPPDVKSRLIVKDLQARTKIGKRNTNNLRYADVTRLIAESEEEMKSLLMRVKEESERAGLRLNTKKKKKNYDHVIQPHYCMENRRGKGGSGDRFLLLGHQSHCGQWLQPRNHKTIAYWQERNDKPRQCVENHTHYSADKGQCIWDYGLVKAGP